MHAELGETLGPPQPMSPFYDKSEYHLVNSVYRSRPVILKHIKLERFCGFADFDLDLREFNALVGLNNSGKTTILRAVKFCQDAVRLGFGDSPQPRLDLVNTDPIRIALSTVLNRLGVTDPDMVFMHKNRQVRARVTLTFDPGQGTPPLTVDASCEENQNNVALSIRSGDKTLAQLTSTVAHELINQLYTIRVEFLPPPGSMIGSEPVLQWGDLEARLAQGRFAEIWRNQLHWLNEGQDPEFFQRIVNRVREYVPDVRIRPPRRSKTNQTVAMNYVEDDHEYDISASGAGLRTLVTLAAAIELSDARILLFDEPDSHLHPSAQRQVAAFLEESASEERQILITTHARDIVEEVSVNSVLWIDRKEQLARRCDEIGRVLVDLGAVSHHQALNDFGTDTVLYVEGTHDRRVYSALLEKCGSPDLVDRIRLARLGGKGEVNKLPGLRKMIRDVLQADFTLAAVVDADYSETTPRGDAKTVDGVLILELPCKELENIFLVSPETIGVAARSAAAVRSERTGKAVSAPSNEDVARKIDEFTGGHDCRQIVKSQWLACWSTEHRRDLNQPGDLKAAEAAFEVVWASAEWRRRCCPGKFVVSRIREWLSEEYNVTVTLKRLLDSYEPTDEMKRLFGCLSKHVEQATAPASSIGDTTENATPQVVETASDITEQTEAAGV